MTKNELKTFTYDFDTDGEFAHLENFEIRVVEIDDKPWFVAKDVAVLLGYDYPANAIQRHCKYSKSWDELHKVDETSTFKLHAQTKLIPESDLYRLVMRSDMPEAERFQDWVVEDVLPTIRKTGGTYMTDDALARTLEDPDYMIGVLQQLKQVKEERDRAIKTKAHISDKKTATAMATASKYSRENKRLKEKYESPSMVAVKAIPWLKEYFQKIPGKKFPYSLIGADLKAISMEFGMRMQEIADQKYGTVKLYHQDAVAIYEGRVRGGKVREAVGKYLKAA